MAVYACGVRLLELVSVEVYKDGLEVVDEFVDPRQVQERAVDSLERWCEPWDSGMRAERRSGGTYNKDDA